MNRKGLVLLATVITLCISGCKEEETNSSSQPTAKVKITVVRPANIVTDSTWPGRVSALRTAQIRPQVGGIVKKRLFEQGTDVKAGQPLFQIDPAPFETDVQMAQAALAKANASYHQLKLREGRLALLKKTNTISQQDYDDARANADQAAASVAEANASLNRKKLDLAYSTVRAPIDGRIDEEFVTEGALVSASDTQAMATVQDTHKVYVDARLPASELKDLYADNSVSGGLNNGVNVTLIDDRSQSYDVKTKILFSGLSVNNETGDVVLRIIADNHGRELMPGMFIRVKIKRLVSSGGIEIPEQAIQRVQNESFVWSVGEGNKAHRIKVLTGQQNGNNRIITEGLNGGEKIITEGAEKLQENIEVKVSA